MTTGGDTGAHFGLAQFLKSNLLPHGHVTGWFPGAYDGLPLNTFYFPLPDTLAALLGFDHPLRHRLQVRDDPRLGHPPHRGVGVRPPGGAGAAPARRPGRRPPCRSSSTRPSPSTAGNLYSTMAGEYAFSLGLSVALVFLGVVVRGMRTGRAAFPAVLLLARVRPVPPGPHTVLLRGRGGGPRSSSGPPAGACGGWSRSSARPSSWWRGGPSPSCMEQAYSTTMGWQNVTDLPALLAPSGRPLGARRARFVGLVIACVRFNRTMLALAVPGVDLGPVRLAARPRARCTTRASCPSGGCASTCWPATRWPRSLIRRRAGWRNLRDALRWAPRPIPACRSGRHRPRAFATGGSRCRCRRSRPPALASPGRRDHPGGRRPSAGAPARPIPPPGDGRGQRRALVGAPPDRSMRARTFGTAAAPAHVVGAGALMVVPFVALAARRPRGAAAPARRPGIGVQARAGARAAEQRPGVGPVELLRRRAQGRMGRAAQRHRGHHGQGVRPNTGVGAPCGSTTRT